MRFCHARRFYVLYLFIISCLNRAMTDRLLFEIFATPITAFELFGALGAFAALLLALAVLRGGPQG